MESKVLDAIAKVVGEEDLDTHFARLLAALYVAAELSPKGLSALIGEKVSFLPPTQWHSRWYRECMGTNVDQDQVLINVLKGDLNFNEVFELPHKEFAILANEAIDHICIVVDGEEASFDRDAVMLSRLGWLHTALCMADPSSPHFGVNIVAAGTAAAAAFWCDPQGLHHTPNALYPHWECDHIRDFFNV